jgi:predicted peptidase
MEHPHMNRLRWLALFVLALSQTHAMNAQDAITPRAADPLKEFEARVFESSENPKLPYRLLKPADYDPQKKYPLVLFLHGAGERGDDNAIQLVHGARNFVDPAMRRRHPAFVVFPQCAAEKKWVEVPWNRTPLKVPEDPGDTMRALFALVTSLQQEFPIDESRIYGVGLSMGGFGLWDMLQRKPELFTAGIPICGGGDPATAERFHATPVWVFHGGADPLVPAGLSQEMVKALQAAGGQPIYTEYEDVGHDSWTQTFDNRLVWDWLFAQQKQQQK